MRPVQMFDPKTLSERLLLCTVRIEVTVANDVLPATGFLFLFEPPGREPVAAVVTNKHALKDATAVAFFFHTVTNVREDVGTLTGQAQRIDLPDPVQGWLHHPDEAVDLCAYPCGEIVAKTEADAGVKMVQHHITKEIVWSDEQLASEFSAVEDVLMVGYPAGLWDEAHNLPLFRRGITATPASVDFDGKPEGLVDIASVGGSSGSPIVILSEGIHINRKPKPGRALIEPGDRLVLLGIAAEQVLMRQEGTIEKRSMPMRRKQMYSVTEFPVHLAYYVKAKALLDIERLLASEPT
jgi:hypothetical protein